MWWGHSPAIDVQYEMNENQAGSVSECLEVLIVGAGDARHIIKTLASSYLHHDRIVTYNVIEPTVEQIARSILLLSICLDKSLGLQEATRYYLEIFGNTLVRPATAKYLVTRCNQLIDIITNTIDCSWFSLEKLKHKDRDRLEAIFKFWERAARENIPIVEHWDKRIRKSLKTRYDYREGVFDWDYHMILKPRGILNLTTHEYRFWRNNGIAFTWLEGEPIRSNPTVMSNIIQHGPGFIHFAYLGDITNGPFAVWTLQEQTDNNKKFRATDVAEQEVMRCIHEIREKEPFCEELVASHRDSSILNGTLVIEMPSSEMERGSWEKKKRKQKSDVSWVDIKDHKVVFYPTASLDTLKCKEENNGKFEFLWIAHNMTKQLPNLALLLKKGATVLVELKKYLTEFREEDLETFVNDLKKVAQANSLHEMNSIHAKEHCIARFCKQ